MPEKALKQQKDSLSNLLIIYIKGIAMGMADIVPGVSGGTIAIITGVYNRLISAISSVDINLWYLLKQHGITKGLIKIWQHLDATFVLTLFLGIATSFLTLASTISHLLVHNPLEIWSLFFGLVAATVFVLLTEIKTWTPQRISLFLIGTLSAVIISQLPVVQTHPSLTYLFFAGALSICAMILPGISGSFILLLLGAYQPVLDALHDKNITIIMVIMLGMLTGLLSFSKFLKWLLGNYYQSTLTLLTGFIAGSLFKIYPWKIDSLEGIKVNVLPSNYPTGAHWESSLSLMIIGGGLVLLLSWLGKKTHQ